ncbi:MAG: VWA domain-containing protein [Candidatus Hydrogenedentes bacterium]|nr:VWA domain-containing protein [Candidatus Hydrogenedentota bacterium]
MRLDETDPRLTAYVLGELEDAEAAEMEATLAESPELQQFAGEIAEAARLSSAALHVDESMTLTEAQRETIMAASNGKRMWFRRKGEVSQQRNAFRGFAFAALLLLSVGGFVLWVGGDAPQRFWLVQREPVAGPESEVSLDRDFRLYEAPPAIQPAPASHVEQRLSETAPANASAETAEGSSLQNVQVGGEIRIRENYFSDIDGTPSDASEPAPAKPESEQDVEMYQAYLKTEDLVRTKNRAEPQPTPEKVDELSAAQPLAYDTKRFSILPEGADCKGIPRVAQSQRQGATPVSDQVITHDLELPGSGIQKAPVNAPNDSSGVTLESLPEVNVIMSDSGAAPTGVSGGGGFGGGGAGGYGGGGVSTNGTWGYGSVADNGGYNPVLSNGIEINESEQRQAGSNLNYNRFVGDGNQPNQNWASPADPEVARRLNLARGEQLGEDGLPRRRGWEDDDGDTRGRWKARTGVTDLYAYFAVPGTESYARIPMKPFTLVAQEPLSTFSVDVDTAAYANVRRFLTQGQMPPPDAVRVEEMINYFDYEYAPPQGEDPIAVNVEIAPCVWESKHRLARVALKAREVHMDDRGPANLVFLIDVSGSMEDANKLPLLRESMKALTRQLQPQDRVAIVTYRDAASIALSPTTVGDRTSIETAIDMLHAEGSTNGAGGLDLAYSVASEHVVSGGINRVILATDGDFNVGETSNRKLVQLIRESAATGVFLTVLGFGEGNLKDDRLEAMADKGNGTYHYIDNYNEATRVLCAQVGATLATVAKDVKIQVEFNPAHVSAYRLIGYENRALAAADFNNDRKDAGEMGSGEAVTALYELVPAGMSVGAPGVDALKYQPTPTPPPAGEASPETMTVKIRYKEPEGDASRMFEVPVVDSGQGYDQSSRDYRWAVAVAGFGMVLRHPSGENATWVDNDGAIVTQTNTERPEILGTLTLDSVRDIAEEANGYDPDGRRAEFLSLVVAAQTLTQR